MAKLAKQVISINFVVALCAPE